MPTAPCQLIVDPPAAGPWNMAVDEALLTAAAASNRPVLRLYQWQRPTLSLGYFQRWADRELHRASLEADVLRRLSGGGAILHDRELTYSLILPRTHPWASDAQALYEKVHCAIVEQLELLIAQTDRRWQLTLCEATSPRKEKAEPFLCFQRRAPGDVLLRCGEKSSAREEHKIIGSAQRRRRGAVLQHGSLLLARSAAAPELPGLTDLTGVALSPSEAASALRSAFSTALRLEMQESPLHENIKMSALQLLPQRYASHAWTERR